MPRPRRVGPVKRDGRWFFHPYAFGVMPKHPTGYTGKSLYHDRSRWVVQMCYRRVDGTMALGVTPPSRWRLVAAWHALRGHIKDARP